MANGGKFKQQAVEALKALVSRLSVRSMEYCEEAEDDSLNGHEQTELTGLSDGIDEAIAALEETIKEIESM